jgi:integrase
VFLDPTGANYTIGTWRHGLYRSCRRAGPRSVGWHVLRHTFASHLVMRGATLREVQELMGHGTVPMTLRGRPELLFRSSTNPHQIGVVAARWQQRLRTGASSR